MEKTQFKSGSPQATLEGLNFEQQLRSDGFVPQPGTIAKLGELLVGAEVIEEQRLKPFLAVAGPEDVALGQVLVCAHAVEPQIIIRALKLQSLVRMKKITLESALGKLKRASKKTSTQTMRKLTLDQT